MTTAISTKTNHLATIADRQSKSWMRDAVFAACVALATAVSLVGVSTASHAASTSAETAQR